MEEKKLQLTTVFSTFKNENENKTKRWKNEKNEIM